MEGFVEVSSPRANTYQQFVHEAYVAIRGTPRPVRKVRVGRKVKA